MYIVAAHPMPSGTAQSGYRLRAARKSTPRRENFLREKFPSKGTTAGRFEARATFRFRCSRKIDVCFKFIRFIFDDKIIEITIEEWDDYSFTDFFIVVTTVANFAIWRY